MPNPFTPDTPNYYYYRLMEAQDLMKAGELLITDVKMAEVAYIESIKRARVTDS